MKVNIQHRLRNAKRRIERRLDIRALMRAIDDARLNVWARQPKKFFDRATIDMDGTLVVTTGQCKQGMDISYKGTWGYRGDDEPGCAGAGARCGIGPADRSSSCRHRRLGAHVAQHVQTGI